MPKKERNKDKKKTFGLRHFTGAASRINMAGLQPEASLFKEALVQRQKLMEALRQLDPSHPLLRDYDQRDAIPSQAKPTPSPFLSPSVKMTTTQ